MLYWNNLRPLFGQFYVSRYPALIFLINEHIEFFSMYHFRIFFLDLGIIGSFLARKRNVLFYLGKTLYCKKRVSIVYFLTLFCQKMGKISLCFVWPSAKKGYMIRIVLIYKKVQVNILFRIWKIPEFMATVIPHTMPQNNWGWCFVFRKKYVWKFKCCVLNINHMKLRRTNLNGGRNHKNNKCCRHHFYCKMSRVNK